MFLASTCRELLDAVGSDDIIRRMSTSDDMKEQIAAESARPASTSVGGNSTARRSLTELTQAQQSAAADEQAVKPNIGLRRKQFRHRPPAGGP